MFYQKVNFLLTTSLVSFILFLSTTNSFSTTKGFDMVVIVDQSGSMMGVKSKGYNDPLGVRNDMVRRIFELLAKNGVQNRVTHRLGVVSFGDKVRIDLYLSEIDSSSVEKLRQQLDKSLKDVSLGNTHFLAAFKTAKNMFAKGKKADPGKRVILLITDGAPYIEGIQGGPYVKELRELIEASFPYPDYQTHVIALNDSLSDYWERYREFWRSVSHSHARKLQGDKEHIFRALHEVVNDILGTSAEHVSPDTYNEYPIPPYLESVVFDIFRVNPDVKVEIYSAKELEQPLSQDSKDVDIVNIGRTIQTLTVKKPTPGKWKIVKSDEKARVDIYLQRFFPRGKLLHPDPDVILGQYEKTNVKYRVEDGENNPIEEVPGYPLTLELSLVKPDSTRIQMKMQKSTELSEKSVFHTTREIECDLPGTYHTEVLIATKDLKNRQITIFRDQYSRFEVKEANLVTCNLLRPKSFENIPLYEKIVFVSKPLTFKFKFQDKDGDPVNLPAFFNGAQEDIINTYKIIKNEEQEISLKFTEPGDGILLGQASSLNNPGKYHVKFRPNKDNIPSQCTLRIVPDDLIFSRGLTLYNLIQIFAAGLLLFSILIVTGYNFYVNTRFPLKGTLYIDRLGDRQLVEYPLSRKRSRLVLKEFPIETMIKKINIKTKRDKKGGIIVTVTGDKKKVFLKDRILNDRGAATLKKVPYILRYRIK